MTALGETAVMPVMPAAPTARAAPANVGLHLPGGAAPDTYALGRSESETRRLILQHQIYGPLTRRLLEGAGIGAGMRVLDVGSGAGDVALLLADLVGPTGRVVGVDTNGTILDTAGARAAAAGYRHVEFRVGDAREAPVGGGFDAVVGRWVLMYQPDPAALVRALAARLRPGGTVVFQESDYGYPPASFPPSPLMQELQRWMIPPAGAPGFPELRMGTKLYRTFVDAGLPAPQLRLEAPIGGGPDWPGYEYVAETLRSLLPALQRLIGLDPAGVGIETLADRLRAEGLSGGGVQMLAMVVGAWSRVAP